MTPSLREEEIRTKALEKITKGDMAGKLTCDLGVGVGELAADDDLIRLSPVKVTAGFGELAEEIADVVLSPLIQDMEVGRELHGGVSADMGSNGDLKCNIDKEERRLTQGGDGAAEGHQKNPHRRACCWPFALVEEKRLGFLEA